MDSVTNQLFSNGKPVPLEPKVFQTLLILVRNSGRIVERDELMGEIWPDSFVEDTNLARNISILRKVLGKAEDGTRYIETIPKRGYRFLGRAPGQEFLDRSTGSPAPGADADAGSHDNQRTSHLRSAPTPPHDINAQDTGSHMAPLSGRAWLTPIRERFGKGGTAAIALSVLVLLIASAAAIYVRDRGQSAPTLSSVHSIAVLPFKQLGDQGTDEYLGLGMADALITRLGNLRGIKVRPTAATQRLLGDDREPGAIGRALRSAWMQCSMAASKR